jgi:hypothetical protein
MSDPVHHPAHYQGFSNGAEVIDITENLSFNLGNVVKYVARAGRKTDDPIEDLRKAQFYLEREIKRLVTAKHDGAWSLEGVSKELHKLWDERMVRWVEQHPRHKPDLPEGLVEEEGRFWRDNEGWLWGYFGETWRYYEKDDEEWIDIAGPPSNIYTPFKEVDLWHKG